ncbi:MAG TPA: xanthine dehydrogenase family protein molybdopterin-binding subunit [Candidatus Dormibacteraeota bacterium]|nr:xanthine dehydrogenase family protein molybdopterin-binding subunit [Candidatus Dormibacteraeota bacterium]
MPRIDALEKISGRAVFAADVSLPHMCHAAVTRSQLPHAKLVDVDCSEALGMPGVIAAVAGRDLAPRLYGRRVRDVPILVREEVRFIGERVAAAVAETREQAERAAARIRVEYAELPAVLDAQSATEFQATYEHGSEGDVDRALAGAAHVVDEVYTTPSGHHGYIEPQACVAEAHADGRIDIWIANKSPYRLRDQLAACFEIDAELITIHPVAIGGDFGGKGSPMDAPLCIELSRLTGRPVKLVQRYWEDLIATNPRHAARIRVRIGCDPAGVLVGLHVDALLDGGAYAGFKPRPTVTLHGLEEPGGAYRVPHAFVRQRIAYTHTVPRGHMRAPGSPQATFAIESALDELSARAAIEPAEIRRRNLVRSGEPNAWGVTWAESRGEATLDAALRNVDKAPAPEGWRWGSGLAVYERGAAAGRTSLRLITQPGGRLRLEVAMPEPGPGGQSVARDAIARALAIDPSSIDVVQVDTSELPNDDGVGASRVTGSLSIAAADAAAAMRESDGGPVTVVSRPEAVPSLTSFCVQVAQVAVDPESGRVLVLEVLSAVDVAEIINPPAHRQQIEGGAAMGFGFACLEDLDMREGRAWAANMGEFRIPSTEDVPRWKTVLVPGARGLGALNVKSAGELSNSPTAAAIANAVANACGVRMRELPLTADKVYRTLVSG